MIHVCIPLLLLQVRRPIGTLVEILVPPAACVVIITLK